jgi:hypothetical protein
LLNFRKVFNSNTAPTKIQLLPTVTKLKDSYEQTISSVLLEFIDCSSGDGMSTGGHHTGDLPSLVADANGVAKLRFESTSITIDSGLTNIVGRGLIVHRDPDDFKTQPTGNAGPRLACAVIAKN